MAVYLEYVCKNVLLPPVFALFVSLLAVPAIASNSVVGVLTSIRGVVIVKRPGVGQPLAARRGLEIRIGDVIRTENGGFCQISLKDESFINLDSSSGARINQYAFDRNENRRTAVIQLIEGRARVIVFRQRSETSRFTVETDIAAVETGGLCDVVISAQPKDTEVTVLRQGVRVRNRSAAYVGSFWLGENRKTMVPEHRPPTLPQVLAPDERRQLLKSLKSVEVNHP